MKALPVRLIYGVGYEPCQIGEATHVTLNIPGPTGQLTLPVITTGTRAGTGCWTWNGSTDAPTLRPSVLTEGHDFRCHSWINDGVAQFLDDCSHELSGQTVPLLDAALAAQGEVRKQDTELIQQMLEIIESVSCDSIYEQNCKVCNTVEAARKRLENT